MSLTAISLPCGNLAQKITESNYNVALSGNVSLDDVAVLKKFSFHTLDLSAAVFGTEFEEYCICLGYSHSGPVYGASRTRSVDVLKRLLDGIEILDLVLPESVAKRHMNVIAANPNIYSARVPDSCSLFAMQGDCIYNRKKTILIFEPRPVEYATCADCGKQILASHSVTTADGTTLCRPCAVKGYEQCDICNRWHAKGELRQGFGSGLNICPDCIAEGWR